MKILNTLLLLFLSLSAIAQTDLLNEPLRPRISVVREQYDSIQIDQATLVSGNRINLDHFRDSLEKGAPQFIAKLEKAYPNGTFMFIGRDTQLIADVVEAFYLSIGNKSRVKQVGVSTPTLAGLDADGVMNYLAQYGISIENLKKTSRPMILVDTISKGEVIDGELVSGRQGRYIMQVVYQKWIEAGLDPKELLTKFNMIGMQVSTFRQGERSNNYRYAEISSLEDIQKENFDRLTDGKYELSKIGRTIKVPLVKDTSALFNESGYDHFTSTWHDKYQTPKKEGSSYIVNPGALMSKPMRLAVLWMQKKVVDFAFKPDFTKRVISEGQILGVTFKVVEEKPAKVEVASPAKSDFNSEYKKRVGALQKSLKKLPAKYEYDKFEINGETIRLTENGYAVLKAVSGRDAVAAEKYFEISLELLDNAFHEDLIGRRDYRRILTHILGLKEADMTKLVLMIHKRLAKSEPLNELFQNEDTISSNLKSKNSILANNVKAIINQGSFGFSCRYVYE